MLNFKAELDESLPKIKVISQDIGRVFLNIINNAFYAVASKAQRGENGFVPEVILKTKKLSDKVEIRIKDNADGIPRDVLDKIFQPFFTTKPSGQGTGLGLSLSYDIITKGHGGHLAVDTKDGEGTEFIIELPIKP
jgi:two-component system NtrC family sensor kinase